MLAVQTNSISSAEPPAAYPDDESQCHRCNKLLMRMLPCTVYRVLCSAAQHDVYCKMQRLLCEITVFCWFSPMGSCVNTVHDRYLVATRAIWCSDVQ